MSKIGPRMTWQEWDKYHFYGLRVHDPDGFRYNPAPDDLYTFDEFIMRLGACTVEIVDREAYRKQRGKDSS